ncbi:hypothetical protein Peur_032248 [Populus x canadensis]
MGFKLLYFVSTCMRACEPREKHSRSGIFPRQNPPLWRYIVGMWWIHRHSSCQCLPCLEFFTLKNTGTGRFLETSCFAPPKETKREGVKYFPLPTSFCGIPFLIVLQ